MTRREIEEVGMCRRDWRAAHYSEHRTTTWASSASSHATEATRDSSNEDILLVNNIASHHQHEIIFRVIQTLPMFSALTFATIGKWSNVSPSDRYSCNYFVTQLHANNSMRRPRAAETDPQCLVSATNGAGWTRPTTSGMFHASTVTGCGRAGLGFSSKPRTLDDVSKPGLPA